MPTNLHRYYGAGYSHFITTGGYQRRPLLGTPRSRDLFLEVMEQVRQRHQFVVVGYVIMPEHVHLLFTEPGRGNLSPLPGRNEWKSCATCTAIRFSEV
jgi:putative transposase